MLIHIFKPDPFSSLELGVPDGATYTASPDGAGRLVVTVDLLIPGEVFSVGLTVADAQEGRVKVIARGELLEVKEIGEHVNTEELLEILMPRLYFGSLILDLYRLARRSYDLPKKSLK